MAKRKGTLELEFGTPKTKRDYRWAEIAAALRERPGEWALVHRDLPASVPWSVGNGRVKAVAPSRGFRYKTVGNRRPEGGGPKVCSELWLMYDPASDQGRARKNGARK